MLTVIFGDGEGQCVVRDSIQLVLGGEHAGGASEFRTKLSGIQRYTEKPNGQQIKRDQVDRGALVPLGPTHPGG
jgi:hypothetical protein